MVSVVHRVQFTRVGITVWRGSFDQSPVDQRVLLTRVFFDQSPIDQRFFDQRIFDQRVHLTRGSI